MGTLEFDYNDADGALELVVNLIGVGGVPGLTCTVAVREAPTTNSYLDWNDYTFKTVGWVTKFQPMTDIGNGMYQAILNVPLLGFTPLTGLPQILVAEYNSSGVGTSGLASDTIFVSELRPDAKLARQYDTNRATTIGGLPGTFTLYEDDGVTVQSTQTLLDFAGNAVVNTPGTPAQRGKV
jgi:hypothetical protein